MKIIITLLLCLKFVSISITDVAAKSSHDTLREVVENYQYTLDQESKINFFGWSPEKRRAAAVDICSQKEERYLDLKQQVLDPWRNAWIQQSNANFNKVTVTGANAFAFDKIKWSQSQDFQRGLVLIGLGERKKNHRNHVKSYLKEFSSIRDVDLRVSDYQIKDSKAVLKLEIEVTGKSLDGKRRSDVLNTFTTIKKVGKKWLVSSVELDRVISSRLKTSPAFSKVESRAISSVPVYLRREAIRRGGYALTVADMNNDGEQDIYVGSIKQGTLLTKNKKGEFKQDTTASILKETMVKTAIVADFDGDRKNDIVMSRFSPSEKNYGSNDIAVFFQNKNGFIKSDNDLKGKSRSQYAMPATAGDFNRDGQLDFYVGFPGKKDFTHFSKNRESNFATQGIFINQGSKNFEDLTMTSFKAQGDMKGGEGLRHFYPHSSMAIDYDQDGDSDLIVIDDRNNLSPVYQNNGSGVFEQVAEKIGIGNRGMGMSVASGDLNNDGLVDFVMTNVRLESADRIEGCLKKNFSVHENIYGDKGLRVFMNAGQGRFYESTDMLGLSHPGYATAGIELLDYDNDGLLDIYVVNGLWSGNKREQAIDSFYDRAVLKNYARGPKEQLRFSNYLPLAQSNFMKILIDFKGDVYDFDKKGKTYRPSLGGYQRNRLYKNLGNNKFAEVAYLEGIDSIADGYIVARTDLDRNGGMDLVLRNADPGTEEYQFPTIEVYKNNLKNNKAVSIQLISESSAYDAIGSYAVATIDSRKTVEHVTANFGPAQRERVLHFGLGKANAIKKLEIFWTSGKKEVFYDIKPGHYIYKEKQGNLNSHRVASK